jgi:hypothetical protein
LIAAVASAAITQSSRLDKGSFNTAVRTLLSNHADLLLANTLGITAQDFFESIPGYENADLETIQKILLGYAVA